MDRRALMLASGAAAVGGAMALARGRVQETKTAYAVQLSPAAWRRKLTATQFAVLREAQTETPGASPLLEEHRRGRFACAGCALPLFSSTAKFDSGTGWPSFSAPLPHAVTTHRDFSMIVPRIEVHCTRCGGHLGHVFDDGPQPTGLRYCMNGAALSFQPA